MHFRLNEFDHVDTFSIHNHSFALISLIFMIKNEILSHNRNSDLSTK